MRNKQLAAAAAAAAPPSDVQDAPALVLPEYLGNNDLERLTGTKATTWRYWEHMDQMPAGFPVSFKIGRRRVWPKAKVLAWLAEQEQSAAAAAV
jgi:prophage regulatory protein